MDRSSTAIPASLVLAREPYAGKGPQRVVARAERELVVRYGFLHEGERGLTAAMFDPPAGAFLVARRGDATGPPLGGVGLRAVDPDLHPTVGEIRRLWVDPAQRGQGIARRLMAALEDTARDMGLTALRLVTGEHQPEAIALYQSTGWELADPDTARYGYRFTKELVGPE
jgi:ribosomal protein S18 acetylase RimI-like enzyme